MKCSAHASTVSKGSLRKRFTQLFGDDSDGDTISPIQKRSAPTCSTQLFDDDSDNDAISTIQKRQLLVKIPIGNQLRVDPRLVDPRLVRTEMDVPQESSWK